METVSQTLNPSTNRTHDGRPTVLPDLMQFPMNFHSLTSNQWDQVAKRLRLTPREREVCELLFQCKTRRETAEHLGISERTVRGYMEQLHTKLAVNCRVGVVLRIIQVRDNFSQHPA